VNIVNARAGVFVVLATAGHAIAKPRPSMDDLHDRAVAVIDALTRLETIDARDVAGIVARDIASSEQVTPARHESRLVAGPVFSSAVVIVGGRGNAWRVVDLTLDADLELTLGRLEPVLRDLPYEPQPWIVQAHPPRVLGIAHHFAVRAGELIVHVGNGGRVERVILTTDRTLAPNATTWRTKKLAASRGGTRGGR
jgi:hypothetical protein